MKWKTHILAVCFTIALLLGSSISFGQPKIKFETLDYTMNPVRKGEPAIAKIPFKNIGSKLLIIESAQGTGPPVINKPEKPTYPNETDYITVKIPTSHVGTTRQTITIRTNVDDKIITLIVRLKVLEDNKNDIIIFGIISDDSGGIPGASIAVKGTNKSSQTDIDGKYTIKALIGDYLLVSSPGLITKEVCVENSEINIKLEEHVELSIPCLYPIKKNPPDIAIISAEDLNNANNSKYFFNKDLKDNNLKIYSSFTNLSDSDYEFQLKYNITYSNIMNQSIEYYYEYNKLTFKFLTKKFKKKWQESVRKDAIGLK